MSLTSKKLAKKKSKKIKSDEKESDLLSAILSIDIPRGVRINNNITYDNTPKYFHS